MASRISPILTFEKKDVRLQSLGGVSIACLCAAFMSTSVLAQQAPDASSESAVADSATTELPEEGAIVVTGTRVARQGFEAPTPVTVFGSADLQNSASTNFADQLNKLPSLRNTKSPAAVTLSSQNAGGNFLDLRGLGAERTLVLVNGRRHVPTTSTGTVDVNVIPTGIIARTEVVTGGASAAWGSDAVAGVVNLILDDTLDGLKGTAQAGTAEAGDNKDYFLSLAGGTKFGDGRGHLLIGAEYANSGGSQSGENRKWYRNHYLAIVNPAYTPTNGQPQMLAAQHVTASNAALGGLINSGPLKGIEFLPGGQTRQFQYGTNVGSAFMTGGDGVYTAGLQPHATPLERYNLFTRATYDISDSISSFAELSFAKSRTAYEMDFFTATDTSILIKDDNAFLPANVRSLMAQNNISSFTMGRIGDDTHFYQIDDSNRTFRAVAGLNGTVFDDWKWSLYGQHGQTRYKALINNNRITANFTRAVDAVTVTAANVGSSGLPLGSIACRSTLTSPTDGCVPINLFGAGSPSAAALDYIGGDQRLVSTIKQSNIGGDIQGEPFSTWAGPVSLVGGFEYRKESVNQSVDAGSLAGIFSIGNPKPLVGSYTVKELFGETVVPLAKDLPFATSIELNGAVRYTKYSTSGAVTTWKLGGSWEPTDGIKLRVTRSRDIRAPSISELYSSFALLFSNISDPVTNRQGTVAAPTLGNPALQPERADTTTLGLILQPAFAPGLKFSADYYDIRLNGIISSLSAQNIVTFCAQGTTFLCQYITRDSSNAITQVVRAYVNLASTQVRGVDFEMVYGLQLSRISENWGGAINARIFASYLDRYRTFDGTTVRNLESEIGTSGPKWRGLASLAYERGPLTVYGEVEYVGKGIISASTTYDHNNVKDYATANMSVSYKIFESGRQKFEIFGAVNNLLNTDPRIVPFTYRPTNSGTYDVFGRSYSWGVRMSL